jgi:hypothetical protein
MIYSMLQTEGGIPIFFPALILLGRVPRLLRRRENRGVNSICYSCSRKNAPMNPDPGDCGTAPAPGGKGYYLRGEFTMRMARSTATARMTADISFARA